MFTNPKHKDFLGNSEDLPKRNLNRIGGDRGSP